MKLFILCQNPLYAIKSKIRQNKKRNYELQESTLTMVLEKLIVYKERIHGSGEYRCYSILLCIWQNYKHAATVIPSLKFLSLALHINGKVGYFFSCKEIRSNNNFFIQTIPDNFFYIIRKLNKMSITLTALSTDNALGNYISLKYNF